MLDNVLQLLAQEAYDNDAGADYWGNRGAGILAIARDTGRILVALRSAHVNEPGTWGTIGGRVDEDESFEAAALREFDEETGYSGLIALIAGYMFVDEGVFEYQNFIGILPNEIPDPSPNWETSAFEWVTLDELESLSPKHPGLEMLISENWDKIEEYSNVRDDKAKKQAQQENAPRLRDIQDAIEYSESLSSVPQDVTTDDFDLRYLGKLKAEDFYEYDDLFGWLEIEKGELNTPEGDGVLNSYRGYGWAGRALRWIEEGNIPPVIIVDTPWGIGVGDGRGRINLANGLDIPIDAYVLVYNKDMSKSSSERFVAQQENLPPQQGYPEVPTQFRDLGKMPEPIGYVYHVSPYAREILEEGFIIDPTKTTLGAFGELNSISTTSYDNAVVYQNGIKTVVGVANGEIDTEWLIQRIGRKAKDAAKWRMEEDFGNFWNRTKEETGKYPLEVMPPAYQREVDRYDKAYAAHRQNVKEIKERAEAEGREPTDEEISAATEEYNSIKKPMTTFFETREAQDWLWYLFENDLDFYGQPLDEEAALKRRWEFLKSASLVADLPLVVGYDPPEHLKTRTMADVGIVEIAVSPVEFVPDSDAPDTIEQQLERLDRTTRWMEESGEYSPEEIEQTYQEGIDNIVEPKGKYTYNPGEQEWKFYDPTDLWPIRLVGNENKKILILDIDDTLACTKHRRHYIDSEKPSEEDWANFMSPEEVSEDPVVADVDEYLGTLIDQFDEVYYLTGRPEDTRDVTEYWLSDNLGLMVSDNLLMKEVPKSRGLAFKQREIERLVEENPQAEFVFIDNEPENLQMMSEYGLTLQAPQIWEDISEFFS